METRYAITGLSKQGKRINIFSDGRTYKLKRYAERIKEQMDDCFEYDVQLEIDKVEIETELDRHKKALEYAMNCMQSEYRSQLRFDADKAKINQILGKEEGE